MNRYSWGTYSQVFNSLVHGSLTSCFKWVLCLKAFYECKSSGMHNHEDIWKVIRIDSCRDCSCTRNIKKKQCAAIPYRLACTVCLCLATSVSSIIFESHRCIFHQSGPSFSFLLQCPHSSYTSLSHSCNKNLVELSLSLVW